MSKSRPQQALAVVAAMLLVATAVGGAAGVTPVGTASAQAADNEECSTWDAILYDAANIGNFNLFGGVKEDNPCSASYAKQQIADEWNATDAAETRAEIHARASQLSASNDQYLTAVDNGLTNSETIAFSAGEAAAVEALINGSNVSEAQQAANQSISEFFSVKQINQIDRWGVVVSTIESIDTRQNNTTGLSDDLITTRFDAQIGAARYDDGSFTEMITPVIVTGEDHEFGNAPSENITLLNGSEATVRTIAFDNPTSSTQPSGGDWFDDGYLSNELSGRSYRMDEVLIRQSDNLNKTVAVNVSKFWTTYQETKELNNQTQREVAAYINSTLAPAAEQGNLSDHISPATLAQEYATEVNGSDGYVRALSVAASTGMSTPDLSNTASMTVTHNGTTYEGMLLSQNGPDGDSWQAGETYQPSIIPGTQLFAVSGDEGRVITLDGPFTVESITDTSGNEIDTATTQSYDYQTTNESADYSALQQQIRDLQEDLEIQKERATAPEPGVGGGGGDGGGFALPSWSDVLPSDGVLAGLAVGGGTLALLGLIAVALVIGIIIRVVL